MKKNYKNKGYLSVLVMGVFFLLLAGCGSKEEQALLTTPYEQTEFLMGTYVTLRVYDEGKEGVLEEAFARVEELADKVTVNEPGSEIDKVNQAAGEEAVELSDDVYPLIETAAEYSEVSNGGFDYTVGPITDLWRIGFDDARKPDQSEIDAMLPLVDYSKVELDAENQSIFLTQPGMALDLGAIAKGYIADEIKVLFEEAEVTTAIIDLGGNVVVLGGSPTRQGEAWNIGIQDPMSERGETVGKTKQKDRSIVTSGIYERYLEVDGEIYHHLMNPETGYPFDNEIAGVSIISERSIDGDALSTVVFGLGLEDGLEYVNNREDIEAVFITKDKEVYTSEGLMDNFELTNEDYTWMNK
ncbi:FAD:protein FMN transferase [Desemzia sp. RIT804]|uniref:FAD:protein FMN transferase n=1 Tax=Desemzia sp. RIT 804 TaxID=2810209 RepID=UPI00194E2702|nr:FAD:protein FMN transferase [Desemzia sp. RIT 804]MBM6615197.1 FAD:protein FMN transferase [Desemzia sp. RIT 804]